MRVLRKFFIVIMKNGGTLLYNVVYFIQGIYMTKEELQKLKLKHTNKEIAQIVGKSIPWVEKKVKEFGLSKRPYYPPLENPPTREELKSYLKSNGQLSASKHFGVALKTIQNLMKKYELSNEECKLDFISKEELQKVAHKSYEELSEMFNVPNYRIKTMFKELGVKKVIIHNVEPKVSEQQVKDAIKDNNQIDAAAKLGISVTTLFKNIKRYGIKYKRKKAKVAKDYSKYDQYPKELTPYQKDFIIGHLLGDGSIPCSKNTRHKLFSFGQKEKCKEWVQFTFDKLRPFTKNKKIIKVKKTIEDKIFYGYAFKTTCHPIFTQLRKIWYEDAENPSRKILPKDLVLNWDILSIWYLDDGCNGNRCIYLYSQSFSEQDNEFILSQLHKLGITSAKLNHTGNGTNFKIRIGAGSYSYFLNNVKKFGMKCFSYKFKEKQAYKH